MVTKIKRSIANSKNKQGFKQRENRRVQKKHKQADMERMTYVDKRQLLEEKKNKRKQRKGGKPQDDEDSASEAEEDKAAADEQMSSDNELEQELQEAAEVKNQDQLDETVFEKFAGGELDLPEDEEDLLSESDVDAGEDDSDLDAYYEELGIDPAEMTDKKGHEEKLYKRKKKTEKRKEQVETAKRERNEILDAMMAKARSEPNYKTLTRIIQVVKAVFTEKMDQSQKNKKKGKDEDEDAQMDAEESKTAANKHKKLTQALKPEEYQRIVQFFAKELPTLALQVCHVKEFPSVDKLVKRALFKGMKLGSDPSFSLQASFPSINKKNQNLLKSFASNYNRLLAYLLAESEPLQADMLTLLFANGADVARCCLPFKVYAKKLANSCARASVLYGSLPPSVLILSFSTLRSVIMWGQDPVLFEATLKRMYNEFYRASKQGGGSYEIQNSLRTSQNCFIELLAIDRAIGYQMGFQYIRQLCLHLRQIRNNLTKDAVKNIYSWQFYHCLKLWVLALTNAKISDLALLVHPLVQLIVGVIRLSNNLKYFPSHLKLFELLVAINAKTGQFVPAAQYILYPLDPSNGTFFNAKPKPLQDKAIPDTLVSLKLAKKHVGTQEAKDRIIKEVLESLTLYLAANGNCLAFPEIFVPISVLLRKFKKQTTNGNYKKSVQAFLDLITRHENHVAQTRGKIKDKSLRDPAKLYAQFAAIAQENPSAKAPLTREQEKLEKARADHIHRKLSK